MVLTGESRSIKIEKACNVIFLKIYVHSVILRSSLFFKGSPSSIRFGLFDP